MARGRLGAFAEREVSLWLDTLSRELLEEGRFAELVDGSGISGATSNPTIFERAISGSLRYDEQIAAALAAGRSEPGQLFRELAIEDVRRAAEALAPVWEASDERDGYVSLQCNPRLADDVDATVREGLDLWMRLAEPNVMIKVAATDAGIAAIEELTAAGVNVNVTLLFSRTRYEQAIEAYLRGLERRVERRQSIRGIHSVASFFVSRTDAKADERLPASSPLRGRIATANARSAYVLFRERFATPRWQRLAMLGANAQRPLWASTATKNPSYRDVEYLEQLALRGTILTVPEPTLDAFADHGDLDRARPLGLESERLLAAFGDAELLELSRELELEGVDAFRKSYAGALEHIEARIDALNVLTKPAFAVPALARGKETRTCDSLDI